MNRKTAEGVSISIVGMGGIGSHLLASLVPALHKGGLSESCGGVTIHVFDSDTVAEGNLLHQRFMPGDVGRLKVDAIRDSLGELLSDRVQIVPHPFDVREPSDKGGAPRSMLDGSDFLVVCVDSDEARRIVHSHGSPWLDLRCRGDGYVAIDHRVEGSTVESLFAGGEPASCQLDGALESGNIQFGYMASACHGAQWVVQMLRIISGQEGAMLPIPTSASITFGTLGRLPVRGENTGGE